MKCSTLVQKKLDEILQVTSQVIDLNNSTKKGKFKQNDPQVFMSSPYLRTPWMKKCALSENSENADKSQLQLQYQPEFYLPLF
jgi:hypothetical protein